MRLLMIEDEDDFVQRVQGALRDAGRPHEFRSATGVGLDQQFDQTQSHEEQLLARVRELQGQQRFDLVLLDSDLSRMRNGLTQSLCRQAFQQIGVPVCRYKKKHSATAATRLQDLKRLAREGASAVWVPPDFLKAANIAPNLVPWLYAIEEGFAGLRKQLAARKDLLEVPLGPAGLLSSLLGRPSLKGDLLGYTAQNLFFFGTPVGDEEGERSPDLEIEAESTRLGYWLFNYIMAFPGPILSSGAAAAYLNLQPASFALPEVQAMISPARYGGPFNGVEAYYWRDDLAQLLDSVGGDIAQAQALKPLELQRVDADDLGSTAYFCLLTEQPIKATEAAENPDWIPSGAQLARIQSRLFDQLGPMLSL